MTGKFQSDQLTTRNQLVNASQEALFNIIRIMGRTEETQCIDALSAAQEDESTPHERAMEA